MSEKPPKHTDSAHDSWDADAFEAHAAERSNAAASPEAGKPETPQEARLRLGNIIHKFNYQEVRQPETDDETEGQTMTGHEDAKHVSQNEGTEHWQDNDARHDALNPGSYSATRRRIDALALDQIEIGAAGRAGAFDDPLGDGEDLGVHAIPVMPDLFRHPSLCLIAGG